MVHHKIVLFALICLVSATTVTNNQGVMDSYVNPGLQSSIDELTQSKIGHMVIDLAEVTMRVTGAVDSLVEGVKAFGRQIEERLNLENTQWEVVESEHNAKVISLSSQANQAEFDINREKKVLNSELIPRLHELDDILLGLKAKQTDNTQSFKEAEAARNTQHESFVLTTTEFTDALRNIDEALDLLTDLFKSGEVRAAFIEVSDEQKHKVNKALRQVKANTENFGHQYSSFIQALTNLTEGFNFKDRQVLKEMCDFLNSLRLNIFDALTKAYKDEDSQKQQDELRRQQLTAEKAVFDQQYADFYQEREDKTVRISDVETLISTREADLKAYQDRLRTENNNYSANLKIHDDIVSSVQQELAVLAKALQVVQTPPFLDFLNGRIAKA
ncbi:unnamed protein product (macronuclear) [Paramecium tetraurelia]|uniref:Uncharacterized protein n=1 Tax=Paramecium tetraurelia TaxID=5888 RepID=A0DIB6_PARTE|nr:uncharacterized protein GSPATT00017155001 [Paramecium tetraurelia]CAK82783.1 unnamed protein product [Paramecium tetraurelia]|eukprot:XP_001450180.1 hypothetical protein (macronuclear) [Paramecium tetraurelia strain d4-2]